MSVLINIWASVNHAQRQVSSLGLLASRSLLSSVVERSPWDCLFLSLFFSIRSSFRAKYSLMLSTSFFLNVSSFLSWFTHPVRASQSQKISTMPHNVTPVAVASYHIKCGKVTGEFYVCLENVKELTSFLKTNRISSKPKYRRFQTKLKGNLLGRAHSTVNVSTHLTFTRGFSFFQIFEIQKIKDWMRIRSNTTFFTMPESYKF